MPYLSSPGLDTDEFSIDIVTFALDGPKNYDKSSKPLYIEAEDTSRFLTCHQTIQLTRRLIAGFKHVGLQPGDRVLVHLPSTYIYSSIIFGIIGAQGIYVASNPAYRLFELNHLFEHARPALIITTTHLRSVILEAANAQSIPHKSIIVLDTENLRVEDHLAACAPIPLRLDNDDGTSSGHPFENLLGYGEDDWHRITSPEMLHNTHAAMFPTSGTTAMPKLAVFSHFGLMGELRAIFSVCERQVTRLMSLPLFLKYGFLMGHIPTVRWGSPMYITQRFKMDTFVAGVRDYHITELTLVPAMIVGMLRGVEHQVLKQAFTSVRVVNVGGGTLDKSTFDAFRKLFHEDAQIAHGYGLSETGPLTITQSHGAESIGTIGAAFPGIEIKLVNEHGRTITEDGVPGIAWCRSSCAFVGYIDVKGKITTPIDDQGWFCTGDVLSWKGQDLCFVGRSKELIKVNRYVYDAQFLYHCSEHADE